LLAALALAGCGTGGLAPEQGADVADGKLLFTQRCGGCHTMREAGTKGSEGNPAGGPNLDAAFSASRSEDFPPMPRNLVKGDDADNVAAYVAEVAGNPKAKVSLPPGAGGNDPKLLFQSNCGSCHTLADAGTSGTIGPNLDQVKPTMQRAVTQITNGGGGMPPFKGQLTPQQIQALAQYVFESTH
jgi:mono/diheme cytochrome c family protein